MQKLNVRDSSENKHIERFESKGPRNFENPEPLNVSHIGKSLTITLVNGRTESGVLKSMGAYMISIDLPNKKELIINKGAIITVTVM